MSITAQITSVSQPLPSHRAGGTFRCLVFRDVNNTKLTYKTHVNKGALNEHKWNAVAYVGIVLSGLEVLPNYKGVINADYSTSSGFKLVSWKDYKDSFESNQLITLPEFRNNPNPPIYGRIINIIDTEKGRLIEVLWQNGNTSQKLPFEIVRRI
jgi:hypothetical protein